MNAQFVSSTSTLHYCQRAYFNPSQYQIKFGRIFLWILLKDYPNQKYLTPFWLSLTNFLNTGKGCGSYIPRRSRSLTWVPFFYSLKQRQYFHKPILELHKNHGTRLRMSSSYHPQTNRPIEVVNRQIECYLHCFASDQPKKWIEWLHWQN